MMRVATVLAAVTVCLAENLKYSGVLHFPFLPLSSCLPACRSALPVNVHRLRGLRLCTTAQAKQSCSPPRVIIAPIGPHVPQGDNMNGEYVISPTPHAPKNEVSTRGGSVSKQLALRRWGGGGRTTAWLAQKHGYHRA